MNRFWETKELKESPLYSYLQRKRQLFGLHIELTHKCNNNCIHCYVNDNHANNSKNGALMTLPEFRKLAEDGLSMEVLSVLFSGGEPLLRKDFKEIYLMFKRYGYMVKVFTNAVLIDEGWIEFFENYPPQFIDVTVYGISEETYEAVSRVPGSFERFQHGVNLLNASSIPINYKAVFMRSNLHEFEEISAFCEKHSNGTYRFDAGLSLRTDGNDHRNQEILKERLSAEEVYHLLKSRDITVDGMKKLSEINEKMLDNTSERLFKCGAGTASVNISPDGKVYPCHSLSQDRFSFSLREYDLHTIWNDLLPEATNIPSKNEHACGTCQIKGFCDNCPAAAFLATGDFEGRDEYFCQIAHYKAHIANG